jgi:hypothetical protein
MSLHAAANNSCQRPGATARANLDVLVEQIEGDVADVQAPALVEGRGSSRSSPVTRA